jgi:hypothetical protein
MASYSYTFVSGDTVTPTKLNNARTVSDIVNADIKSDAAIAHTKLASITAGQVLLGNGSNVPTATALSGDVTVNSSGVTAISSDTIVNADINASAAIDLSKLATGALPTAITVASANLVDGTIVNADINDSAAIDLSKLATGALPSAITVASANIVNDTIVDADINSAAAIAHSKLANITAGSILMGNTSDVPTATALTGDVTINSSGVTAIGSGVVVNADISAVAGIEGSKLANTTITATQLASNAVETAKINNGAVSQAKLATNVAGTGPVFRAYAGTTTTAANLTPTKITFDTEDYDTNSNFSTSRFTPTVAGYYQINAGAEIASPYATNPSLQIYKNGSSHTVGYVIVGTAAFVSVSDIVYCNGSSDYIEIFASHVTGGNITINASQTATFFSGCLVRAA